jgi:hypothetical protein
MHAIEHPGALERCARALEGLGRKSNSTEELAVDAVNRIYNFLCEEDDSACALIRFFRTMAYSELTPHLQETARGILKRVPEGRTNCLTLLASRGSEPAWNDRFQSKHHQVIPLLSAQMVESAPMVAQLISRLGIDVSMMVDPYPTHFLNPKEKNYNVLYVPEALGNSAIVAQDSFVVPKKIQSVIGFGGLLPTGDMFAVVAFMRIFLKEETAQRFQILASSLETAINQVRAGRKTRAKILIADDRLGVERLSRLLGNDHEIHEAPTVEAAVAAADTEGFDLIICGTQFDDSRMFALLTRMKQNKHHKPKPFICFRQKISTMGRGIESATESAAAAAGAACYVDATSMDDRDLVAIVEAYLPEDIWATNGS